MLPTSDDSDPRRDGWFEHRGTWEEVTVGTIVAGRKRTERWEILEVAHGRQVEFGFTLWMRARDQVSGDVYTMKPRPKVDPVTILTQDPRDTETPDPTAPTDTEAIMVLVEMLGAVQLARRNETTGEVTCPDYESGRHHLPGHLEDLHRAEVEHLRFAHGTSVNDDVSAEDLTTLHGQAHNPKWPNIGKAGFPHRHVPEDLKLFTGFRR